MSYLKVTNDCDCADYLMPLQAIQEILVPKKQEIATGEYIITVNYVNKTQYQMAFCRNCWHDVENVIGQLRQVVRQPLIKETA